MPTKAWQQHHHAARHHELAAYHQNQAAKYDEGGDYEKAAYHAYMALGHLQHASQHATEAAKLHADRCSEEACALEPFLIKSAA